MHNDRQHLGTQPQKKGTFISKFNLERCIAGQIEKIREDEIGGKAVWEGTAEKSFSCSTVSLTLIFS